MAQVQVKMFSVRGDDVMLEYDPATANMREVNEFVDRLEKETGGRAFSMATGEQVDQVVPDTREVVIVRARAGG
jgi:hypothetical protein